MTDVPDPQPIEALRDHLKPIVDVRAAAALLGWDQETYMPPDGARGRANQLATLYRIAHQMFTSTKTGELLENAERAAGAFDFDSDEAALVRVTRRDFNKITKLPVEFVEERARARSISTQVWRDARPKNDFAAFRPHLEGMVDYARREAEYLGYTSHPYDALLDNYEPDMTTQDVRTLFARLREVTIPLLRAIVGRGPAVDATFLHREYDETGQEQFGLEVAQAFGYDLRRGRLDRSPHPFASGFGQQDVRITTRYKRRDVTSAIFGIFHESGHAMYEQGVAPSLERTPLSRGTSLGMHESQSRMWENLVGRSRNFWRHYFPRLQQVFPQQLRDVDADAFYRAVNVVKPDLIRVEADEVTYNLHIMVRFELELALLEGSLAAADLPEAWAARMREYLGLTPPDDRDGVMQDIHWSGGSIGYFPTYTLGNVISVQLFEAAERANPSMPDDIGRGAFGSLLGWLREHIHRHGRKFFAKDLIKRATGADLSPEPYLAYLQQKFGEIYGIREAIARAHDG
ncbi:MAG TPA: carboxypeptidase M32 [bacterium]|jgi:carboxypeptidase Taq|nr:carboxypeptidase M32 [bacterium]